MEPVRGDLAGKHSVIIPRGMRTYQQKIAGFIWRQILQERMQKRHLVFMVILVTGIFCVTAGCTQDQPGTATQIPQEITPTLVRTTPSIMPPAPVPQTTYTSNETLVAFVDSAVTYVQANGEDAALKEFSNPKGKFIRGELYIFAYDFNGTTLAHPVNPEKIGVNRLNEGEIGLFLRNMSAVAANGSGFYRFNYINPAHNRTLESKLGYGKKVDENWWLGSGVYTGPADPAIAHT